MPASLPRKHLRVSAWRCRIYLHFCIGPIRCPLSRMAARHWSDQRRAAVSLCNTETGDLRIADSSSRNAVNFSSARTTKRFRSRCGRGQRDRNARARGRILPLLLSTRQRFSPRHIDVSSLRWTAHGFPKACDHKYLFNHRLDRFDHRLDRFDHRLSKRCSALGCVNTLADWSTFKSAAGTVSNSHSYSLASIKSNPHTHSYADSEPDTITKPWIYASASPTSTPPPIAVVERNRRFAIPTDHRARNRASRPYSYRLGSQL